jgi:hypothetical protein
MGKQNKKFTSTHNQETKSPLTVVPTVSETPASPAPPSPETTQISLTAEDAQKVRDAEQALVQVKMQLADIELHLSEVQVQKTRLLSQAVLNNQSMIETVKTIALANGIDPDGKADDGKWNLDTNEMVFQRVQ